MIGKYLFEKFNKFVEGFLFGLGLYCFYEAALLVGWL